jgi:hypothetical protein
VRPLRAARGQLRGCVARVSLPVTRHERAAHYADTQRDAPGDDWTTADVREAWLAGYRAGVAAVREELHACGETVTCVTD